MEMIWTDGMPGVFCNHLVNRNGQISGLDIRRASNFNGNCTIFSKELAKLRLLKLDMGNCIDIWKAFESYPFTLNLEKFKLWCSNSGHCSPFVRWSRIFKAIGSKLNSDTCTDLKLNMSGPTTDLERGLILKDSLVCRLQLVNIQCFQLQVETGYFLDFWLPSKDSLKEMTLYCDTRVMNSKLKKLREKLIIKLREKQVIKFLGSEDQMHNSNIAKELPCLRKLTVRKKTEETSHYYWYLANEECSPRCLYKSLSFNSDDNFRIFDAMIDAA